MALVNTFLCNCGRNIGRPRDVDQYTTGWGVMAWHAKPGQAILHGIKCGSCRINWTFKPSQGGEWCEVEQCCDARTCECVYSEEE